MIAALLFIIPLVGILLSCIAALRSERMRDSIYRSELALVFVLALAAFICCLRGNAQVLRLPGVCGMGLTPVVARAAKHMWEEPCISGERGSGTVFFSGCALKCVFCQNTITCNNSLNMNR